MDVTSSTQAVDEEVVTQGQQGLDSDLYIRDLPLYHVDTSRHDTVSKLAKIVLTSRKACPQALQESSAVRIDLGTERLRSAPSTGLREYRVPGLTARAEPLDLKRHYYYILKLLQN